MPSIESLPNALPEGFVAPPVSEVTPYMPDPAVWRDPFGPLHGVMHGAGTAIGAAVLLANLPLPETVRNQVDPKVLLHAAAQHDCGRVSDFGYWRGEMRKHGPRGAEDFKGQWAEIDPTLSDRQVHDIAWVIRNHMPTRDDRQQRRQNNSVNQDPYDVEPLELVRRIVQDVDGPLEMRRGYYGRSVGNDRLVPISWLASRGRALGLIGNRERQTWFPETGALIPIADELARVSRWDPEITREFPGHQAGAVLEAAKRLGILGLT